MDLICSKCGEVIPEEDRRIHRRLCEMIRRQGREPAGEPGKPRVCADCVVEHILNWEPEGPDDPMEGGAGW